MSTILSVVAVLLAAGALVANPATPGPGVPRRGFMITFTAARADSLGVGE